MGIPASFITGITPLDEAEWAEKIEDTLILIMGSMPPPVENLQLVCPEGLDIKFIFCPLDTSGYYRASMRFRTLYSREDYSGLYIEYEGETTFPHRLSKEGKCFLIMSRILSSDPHIRDQLILAEQCNMFEATLETMLRSLQIDHRET